MRKVDFNYCPSVDVLMLTYNHENFVEQAIESVINQSYHNWHLYIGDDFSLDNTVKKIEPYLLEYPNKITLVKQVINVGITKNLNTILKLCQGDYITNLGGDDIFMFNKIERQIECVRKKPGICLVGHMCDVIDVSANVIGLYPLSHHRSGRGNKNWIKYGMRLAAISIMWKNTKNGIFFDETFFYAADLYFFIQMLGNNGEYCHLDEVLMQYRKTDNSVTEKYKLKCRHEMVILYEQLLPKNKHTSFGREYLAGGYLDYMDNENKRSFVLNLQKISKLILRYPFESIFYWRFILLLVKTTKLGR